MEKLDKSVKAHLFICCRQKEGGKPCCAEKGAPEMVAELKSFVKNNGWKEFIKVSQSSCLGHCESGITAVMYPENKWFHEISKETTEELKELLKVRATESE